MRIRIIVIILSWLTLSNSQGQHLRETLEMEFTRYRVSTKSCTKIVHSSGSLIFIPENAFALNASNSVDSIDIYYREILSPLDMFIHDIPMTYNLIGQTVYLESNGMFEIWGKSKQDTISVHEDKSIEVRLAMSESLADKHMEGYRYDKVTRQWVSYANQLGNARIDNTDDDLWGSAPLQNEIFLEEEWEGDSAWARSDSIRRVAFQVMEIFDFGLFNYDKVIEQEIFVRIQANFINKANQQPLKTTVYIVYDELNSVFYYPPDKWANDFSIIQNKSYKLFSINTEGKIARLFSFPLLQDIQDKAHTFQLEEESTIPTSRQELAKLTGIR